MNSIRRGKTRNPTVKDVAAAAGVSVATVSHVLNKTRFVSEETTAKVESAITVLNYKANAIARHLRLGESRLIGYVVSSLDCCFYTDMAAGIDKTLTTRGDGEPNTPYQLVITDSRDSKQREITNIESLLLRGVDGIIIAPTTTDYRFLRGLLPEGFPVVFLDRQPLHYEADYILLNNRQASFEAASALLKKGYLRIAFVTYHYGEGSIDDTTMERIAGFEEAFTAAAIPLDPVLVRAVPGTSYTRSSLRQGASYRVMRELLDKAVDAVFCGNNFSAVGVVSCLNDAGIRIPRDMAFITYDNDLWMSLTTPQLSSIVQPAEEMGALAAERLLKRFRERDLPPECFRLNANIVYRGSC
jgi:LacI family transcriptional regulator